MHSNAIFIMLVKFKMEDHIWKQLEQFTIDETNHCDSEATETHSG